MLGKKAKALFQSVLSGWFRETPWQETQGLKIFRTLFRTTSSESHPCWKLNILTQISAFQNWRRNGSIVFFKH